MAAQSSSLPTNAAAIGGANASTNFNSNNNSHFTGKEKPMAVRQSNIMAAKAVADVIRTSLGPRGMDKMIKTGDGQVIVTNDGATILANMNVQHPCSRMLVELSRAQDVVAGDGTTSVVVIAGALLGAAERLLERGVHPSTISEGFKAASVHALACLKEISQPIMLDDRPTLMKCALTSLSSKVVAPYGDLIAGIAVDAMQKISNKSNKSNKSLPPSFIDITGNVKIIKRVGGTIDDCKILPGLALRQPVRVSAGGPRRQDRAKIGVIQFCLSPPKTDMEGTVVIDDYAQMDRVLQEERAYLLDLCKRIKKSGCNVLFIQKSILRDAVTDLSLQFLAKLKILVVTDVERDECEFVCKSLGCQAISDIELFTEDKLASADCVEDVYCDDVSSGDGDGESSGGSTMARYTQVTGIQGEGRTVSILCRGANDLVLDEVERSLHDALCVGRCLLQEPAMISGGGAPEVHLCLALTEYARTLGGPQAMVIDAFAESLLVIPTILAENAGLKSIEVVTRLRTLHALHHTSQQQQQEDNEGRPSPCTLGVNVKRGIVGDMVSECVQQPLLVTSSCLGLAAECVGMIMKIDDIVACR